MSFFNFRNSRPDRPAAAALRYDPTSDDVPEVLAVGRGLMADEIVRVAKAHGVALYEDAGLAEALARLNVTDAIPRELYAVVAEVLAYVYRVDAEAKRTS